MTPPADAPKAAPPGPRGVYFSANDGALDWAVAFLESFRDHNPGLPLALIPFDERCDRLRNLSERYRFGLFEDPAFGRLETIGERLELGHTSYGPRWFRRYAAWWGPFERFLYLDCRQLVLCDLTEFVTAPGRLGFGLLHFDCAVGQVYEPGPLRTAFLRVGRGRGFNSGRWASRRGLFSLGELEALADDCVRLRGELNPRNTDQAFLNYCCDAGAPGRAPVRCGHFAEVFGDLCESAWARQPGGVYQDAAGVFRRWDHGGTDHRKRVPILHWAGLPLSAAMPEAELFFAHRDRGRSAARRAGGRLGRRAARPALRLADRLRRHRGFNTLWHSLRTRG